MNLNFAQGTDIEKALLLVFGSFVIFSIYYYWYKENARKRKALQTEFDDILTSDKYKVKGKFESER